MSSRFRVAARVDPPPETRAARDQRFPGPSSLERPALSLGVGTQAYRRIFLDFLLSLFGAQHREHKRPKRTRKTFCTFAGLSATARQRILKKNCNRVLHTPLADYESDIQLLDRKIHSFFC